MNRWVPDFDLEVLCFDDKAYNYLVELKDNRLHPVRLAEFEVRNLDVAATKPTRSIGEYFFTCTAAWICDVLSRRADVDLLVYLDADTFFFSSPECIYDLMRDKDIMICAHDFAPKQKYQEIYGLFNVGVLAFRNNSVGKACAKKWRDQCVDWCYDRLENGKFADQKYLDDWPDLYKERLLVAPPGINTGPWGLRRGEVKMTDKGMITISNCPLIIYHFQGLRFYSTKHFYVGCVFDFSPCDIIEHIYWPYIRTVSSLANLSRTHIGAHMRYTKESLAARALMGYWVGSRSSTYLIWILQKMVLKIINRDVLLLLMGRKRSLK
jgi:hypothetical protein